MKKNNFYLLAQLAGGIFGGTILGIAGFLTSADYGGNHGCFALIDSIYNLVGYESCGAFGTHLGLFLGALIGVLVVKKVKKYSFGKMTAWLFAGAFVLPCLYGMILFPPFGNNDYYIVPFTAGLFMVFSAIPSIIFVLLSNWRMFFKKGSSSVWMKEKI